jgi:predicted amidohydrolase YtcJ
MRVKAFINGKIYVSYVPLRVESGLVVHGERVLYVGLSEKAAEIARILGGDIVDLAGRVVVPGFIDSHLHIDSLGLALLTLDLRGVRSISELKEKLRVFASRSRFTWVLGHGWDQELFEDKRWPTRWDLDEVISDRPVLLTRICLHAGVVNTRGLLVSKISSGGLPGVLRDEKGEPTGILVEEALKHVREKVRSDLTMRDYVEIIKTAQEHLLANGVTTIGVAGCGLKVFRALLYMWSRGELNVRVRVYLYHEEGEVDILKLLDKLGIRSGFGDEYLRIMGVKFFTDGALGPRTAWLSEPYADNPSSTGKPILEPEELRKLIKRAHDLGLQVAVHAIGDRALDAVIEAFNQVKPEKLRHRVEHASLVRDDQLDDLKRLKPGLSIQPHFVISDWWAKSRLGEKRIKWLYRFKTLISSGLIVGFSTDAPVEPVNPWETIYASVTRGKYDGVPYYEDTAQESLTLQEALYSYTQGSAQLVRSEIEIGTLEPGRLADFVVLDKDPFTVPDKEIREIRVLETYIGGKLLYSHSRVNYS